MSTSGLWRLTDVPLFLVWYYRLVSSAGVQDMMLYHGMPLQRGARLRLTYF